MERRICEAIEERQLLSFDYEHGTRVVEPYCHGISTAGHEVLRAFQVRGDGHTGTEDTWKLYRVDRMHHVHMLDETFLPERTGYTPADTEIASIHCGVGVSSSSSTV